MSDNARSVELLPELSEEPVTPKAMRSVLSKFATGVVVLTVGGEHIHGMTANAFSSVSLDPPTVMCCIGHSAVMHAKLTAHRRFGVSIMAAGQRELASYFADKARPLGPAQFDRVECVPGPQTGIPLLAGALAWLECELVDELVSGDHTVFIGSVLALRRGADQQALLFFDGGFGAMANPCGQTVR